MIYLDNAATSFPKPPQVADAMLKHLTAVGASVNRGTYAAAVSAGQVILQLREDLCRLFGYGGDSAHCILTPGATWGLNMALQGWLRPGDHCLVSSMEHNAVMRPLSGLAGVTFDRIPCDADGRLNVGKIGELVRSNTRLVVLAHGSNVSGTLQDAAAVGAICRRRRIPLLLDAAQTAGHVPIDFDGWGLSALAAPGHKGLLGPSGTGMLLLAEDFARKLRPLVTGGTGSASHLEVQPDYLPDKFEPGTPNLPGLYGLGAAVSWILAQGVTALEARETELTKIFLEGLADVPDIRLAGPWETGGRVGVISLDFQAVDNAAAAFALEHNCGILTRCGLHCAPSAHRTLGTYPQGTVRFSLGPFTTPREIHQTLAAIRVVAAG